MPEPPEPRAVPTGPGRCRCGHFATDHMRVAPIEGSASFRLDPSGPCRRCGPAGCARMTAAPA